MGTESDRTRAAGRGNPACAWNVVPTALLLLAFTGLANGADSEPPFSAPVPFEAADISIGEPIPLPTAPAPDRTAAPPETPPARARLPVAPPATGTVVPQRGLQQAANPAIPGNGWLGLVVAESAAPGRFMVAEVAAAGPAAAGGILAGDEVRAIDGLPLENSDDVAQALTAIAPGQQVRLAIARGESVGDVTLEAVARPAAARAWGAASAPTNPVPAAAFADTPAASPSVAVPAVASPPAAAADFEPMPGRFAGPPPALAAAVEPAAPPSPPRGAPRGRTALGVRTVPIDPAIRTRFQLPEASGAYVIGVIGELPAAKAGVPPGSVIVAIDDRPVRSPDELTRLVTAGPVGKPVTLEYVLPGGASRRADVVLQTLEQPLEAALVGSGEPRATDVPALQPQPSGTTARRPAPLDERTTASLLSELRQLRLRIESLERRLDGRDR